MIDPKYTRDTHNIWFPEQREPIYDDQDDSLMAKFLDYWKQEKERMMYGFNLGTVHISGWLYWHTVYWKIAMYVENKRAKRKVRIIETPLLRDIEWDIAGDFIKCEELGKFYDLVGARDFGKSIIAGSRAAWLYTLFDKSEALISAGEYTYIKLVTDKIEDGLINLHPVLKKQRLMSDWKKEIQAGWKDKKTNQPSDKSSLSSIKIRNFEAGNKTMAAIGTRPGFHLIDEQGALQNLIACVKDSDGAWWSGTDSSNTVKPSCLVMLAGTGGDMEVGADAAEIFYHPGSYNMLEFVDEWENRGMIGKFVDALTAKMAFKEERSMEEYLDITEPAIRHIKIWVANKERALKEWWEPEYANALKSGNQKTVLKFKAYWPLKPSDSFLVLTKNDFNVDAAKSQQARINAIGKTGTPVHLYHDGEKICHRFTDDLPISEFPVKTQSTDAPVVIWEFPDQEVPPFGLYTAGVDPYRQGTAEYSDSLGAVYIFKRIHNIQSERYQNLFVAAYVARPGSKEKWNETARMLIKYYNAYTLCENDEYSFIDYMVKKGDAATYLAPQPEWLRDIVPNSKVNRDYGIHRSSDRIRNHLDGLFKSYLDEVVYQEKDDNGSVILERLGVTRVFDPMLLEEIIRFNADGNFDRIIAAELAIALADHLNPQFMVSSTEKDPRLQSYFKNRKSSSQSVFDYSRSDTLYNPRRGKHSSKLFL